MGLQNQSRYKAVERGITAKFTIGAMTANPIYPDLCTMTQSNSADEGYAMLGSMPGVREWLGDRQFHQLRSADLVLANKLWESSLGIRRQDIDDDRIGFYDTVAMELGAEAAHHPDELMFGLINAGETSECWDGQNYYDTDHVWGDSGVQSNILDFTVADVNNVKPGEINEAVHAAVTRMQSFKRDSGKFFMRPAVNPMSMVLFQVPLALSDAAHRAFLTEIRDTNGNVTEVRAPQAQNIVQPTAQTVQYLGAGSGGSDVNFYVHYLGGNLLPFLWQNRQSLTQDTKGITDIEHKDVKHMTEARYNVGYLAWWSSIKVKLAV